MRKLVAFLMVLLLLLQAGCIDKRASASLKVVGQIGGPTQAVEVKGQYAYVGIGLRMMVLDVSDPTKIREIGATKPFGYSVEDIAIMGEKAYIAAGGAGVYIVDINDPAQPLILGNYNTPGYAEGIAIKGLYAYVADGPTGLLILDIRDPYKLIKVSEVYQLNYVFDVMIGGDHAYLAAAGAGLLIADVSNPAKPSEVSSLDTQGYAYGLALVDTKVYVADGWDGLRIIDISNPKQPQETGHFNTPAWIFDVAVDNNTAYIAQAVDGLCVLDVSDETNPAQIGNAKSFGNNVIKLAIDGGTVYVANRSQGLGIFDVSNPTAPRLFGSYSPLGYADHVAISNNFAYVAAGPCGLRVIDISDPSQPRETGSFDTKTFARGVVAAGNYAFVITYGTKEGEAGLYSVDVSDRFHPVLASFLAIEAAPQDIVMLDNLVYVANELGLVIIDVSNPSKPMKLSYLNLSQGDVNIFGAWGVAVSGETVYLTYGMFGLKVINVSNPTNPFVVSTYKSETVNKVLGVTAGEGFAYVTDSPRLHVVDVSDPTKPIQAGFYDLPLIAERAIFHNDSVYIADASAGVIALDVSNPRKPKLSGSQQLPSSAVALNVSGAYIFTGCGEGGLYIIEDLTKKNSNQQTRTTNSSILGRGTQLNSDYEKSVMFIPELTVNPVNAKNIIGKETVLAGEWSDDRQLKACLAEKSIKSQNSNQSLIVTSTADSGDGSLRWVLENAVSGSIITFDTSVFPVNKPRTILLNNGLWLNQGSITIDASNAGVILDGIKTPKGTCGIYIPSDNNIIKGLQITSFTDSGIAIQGDNNTIGGDRSKGNGPVGEGNLIHSNGYAGIGIGGSNNKVIGNYIGVDLSGKEIRGNRVAGVLIANSSGNVVGGETDADRNIISGNAGVEVNIISANRNKIIGNYIGTDASGKYSLGTAQKSIQIELGSFSNVVEKNVIGNKGISAAIVIAIDWGTWNNETIGNWYNEVIGNYIGVDATGMMQLGNTGLGIDASASYNKIGGNKSEERNIISGISGNGIKIAWAGVTDVIVIGNCIGLNPFGEPMGNSTGVEITGVSHIFIGGTTLEERNIISSNNKSGVSISGFSSYNFIMGNSISNNKKGNVVIIQSNNNTVLYNVEK